MSTGLRFNNDIKKPVPMRINFELFNQYHYCDHVKSQPGLRFYQKNQPGLWGEIPDGKTREARRITARRNGGLIIQPSDYMQAYRLVRLVT